MVTSLSAFKLKVQLNTRKQKNLADHKKFLKDCKKVQKKFIISENNDEIMKLAKYKAKKRNLEFSLDLEKFILLKTQEYCYYCNKKMLDGNNEKNKRIPRTTRTLDRINPDKGYLEDNVFAACFRCNQSKSKFEHKMYTEKYIEYYHPLFNLGM